MKKPEYIVISLKFENGETMESKVTYEAFEDFQKNHTGSLLSSVVYDMVSHSDEIA